MSEGHVFHSLYRFCLFMQFLYDNLHLLCFHVLIHSTQSEANTWQILRRTVAFSQSGL